MYTSTCGLSYCCVLCVIVLAYALVSDAQGIPATAVLHQKHIILRHGSRENTNDSSSDLHARDGKLTIRGRHQHFVLGGYLRQLYIEGATTKIDGIDTVFNEDQTIVRSTDFERTLISAQSLLLGLYPPVNQTIQTSNGDVFSSPFDIQLVPIHTVRSEDDALLRGFDSCLKIEQNLNTFISSNTYKSRQAEESVFLKSVEDATSWAETIEVQNSQQVWDYLNVRRLYSSLPNIISDNDFERLTTIVNWWENEKYSHDIVGDAGAGMLVSQISDTMDDNLNLINSEKLFLYFGHFPTLKSLVSLLDLDRGRDSSLFGIPDYASFISVNLWLDGSSGYVSVDYRNGDDALVQNIKVAKCATAPCTFTEFRDTIASELSVKNLVDWHLYCRVFTIQGFAKSTLGEVIIIMTFVVLFAAIIIAVNVLFCKKPKVQPTATASNQPDDDDSVANNDDDNDDIEAIELDEKS